MLLLATGSLLVMIDLDTDGHPVPQHGLFRAFRSATSLGTCLLFCVFFSLENFLSCDFGAETF